MDRLVKIGDTCLYVPWNELVKSMKDTFLKENNLEGSFNDYYIKNGNLVRDYEIPGKVYRDYHTEYDTEYETRIISSDFKTVEMFQALIVLQS